MNPLRTVAKRSRQYRELIRRFQGLVWNERLLLGIACLALVGEILFQLLAMLPIKYVTDGLLAPPDADRAWPLRFFERGWPEANPGIFLAWVCGALIVSVVLCQLCSYYRKVLSAIAGQRMVMKLRKRLYDHLHRLPLEFHRKSRLGDLLLRLTGDIPMLRDILSESLLELVGRLATVVVMLGVMFFLDPVLALVSVTVLTLLTALGTVSTRRMVKIVRKQRRREAALAERAGETLRSVELVKAYGREDEVTHSFARENRSALRAGLKGTRLQASLARWVEIVFAFGIAAVLGLGVWRVTYDNAMSPGDLLFFLSLTRHLNKPLRKAAGMSTRIGKAAACGERISELLAIPTEFERSAGYGEAPELQDSLRLERVTYSYVEGTPALQDVNLRIRSGEKVALVGRNGAGKSTLISLLLRFYEPNEGMVLLDGFDVRAYSLASTRKQFGVVLQETFLFGTTIRENLQFADAAASEEEMVRALEEVGAQFVLRLPQGLDTPLAECGANLSGGERRRLGLACGLLRKAPVLILDEPTSHIDARSRQDLIERLPRLTSSCTAIVVTHDPQMLEWMDRVVFLEEGRIRGTGSHADLRRDDPSYRQLFPESIAPSSAASSG